ncbi:metallophosphoesterase [Marivita sp.]|uniref:metallophosphoesterase n=1 Tax=Marivita sp. TaxID=2003365 RepID=UPI0025C0B2AB|nr:metallophosphoesterase [Marivita sp.]
MLIAQLSDLHLRDDGADPCHDPVEATRRALEAIAAMERLPDAIVITGDIIDRTAKGYAHVLPFLKDAPAPLFALPGNHDQSAEFRLAFGAGMAYHPEHLSFVQPVGEALLIGLDSTMPDGSGGLDSPRLAWLASVLAQTRRPVILAMHHPPFPTLTAHLDRPGFAGAAELAEIVTKAPVCRIIAGHSHRAIQTCWAGVLASTAPAIGHALSLSLTGQTPHRPMPGPPGFDLHLLQEDRVVSHLVSLA